MRLRRHLFFRSALRPALLLFCCVAWGPLPAATNTLPDRGAMAFRSLPESSIALGGVVGQRLEANLSNWLLPAPTANPGMLDMFRTRDRKPEPALVPWAGEFAGKYLISAVQALRLADSPALAAHTARFVADLVATQDPDGYLGPFPRTQRLLGNWDLWGHYHVIEGLLLWHERTGDPAALAAARNAADLICRTYLDGSRRVLDAGSHEMNMAVIHGLGMLYRLTAEPRYRRLMQEIEKDWQRAGDYLRAGLDGSEFFASPRPRWESLHDLQGLVELWRITGETKYRQSFIHHWRSIGRWDRHNTGGFSSGEQATGNPYSPAPIETCCTIAWMALSVDMLRLTGDPRVADELELATCNAALGAQHPSGRWWTYNTPMDGLREASAHTIVFQARAGTPELNCCSVNGPRALGLLSDWAVMAQANTLVVNWHGPGRYALKLEDGSPLVLTCSTDFPRSGQVKWTVRTCTQSRPFRLRFRIPAWSTHSSATFNGTDLPGVLPGRYLDCDRTWSEGDAVDLSFDLSLRAIPGDREAAGRVSLYRGPLLLAYDQRHNAFDETDLPPVSLPTLASARLVLPSVASNSSALAPWLLLDLPTPGNRPLRLCDFASAGATGTRYRSWLPATNPPPPPPITRAPADGATIGAGTTPFRWTTKTNATLTSYRLTVNDSPDFDRPLLEQRDLRRPRLDLTAEFKQRLRPGQWYYWRVVAAGPHGETGSVEPPARFRFDPAQPAPSDEPDVEVRPDGLVLKAPLRGLPTPEFGHLKRTTAFLPAPGSDGSSNRAVRLNGQDQMLVYSLPEEFEDDFTVSLAVRVLALPQGRIGQVFSAWAGMMDDPLRLTVANGQLFARVEAQQAYSTKGVPLEPGVWHRVAAVKSGTTLTLYLDGKRRETVAVPRSVHTTARSCALGGNPNYTGNEFLAADLADFALYFRALSDSELKAP